MPTLNNSQVNNSQVEISLKVQKPKAEPRKKDKNLSLDIKNYQRKTMLNGIDQLEKLDELYDLV